MVTQRTLAQTLIIVLLCVACDVLADQHGRRHWILSGNVSYTRQSGEAFDHEAARPSIRWRATPSGGLFVSSRLAVGLNLQFDSWSRGADRRRALAAGPYAMWHFVGPGQVARVGSPWIPYAAFSWSLGRQDDDDSEQVLARIRYHAPRLDLGVVFMINETLGLNLSAYRAHYFTNQADGHRWRRLTGGEWGLEYGVTAYLF